MFLQTEDFNLAPQLAWRRRPRDRRLAARTIVLWRATRLLLHVFYGLLLATVALPWCARSRRTTLIRRWSQQLLNIMAVRVNVHHILSLLPLPGHVVVLNHVSWLDVFILNSVLPARFVTKADVKAWPLIGFMCQQAGCFFIQRQQPRALELVNQQIRQAIANDEVVAIFPEGTTTQGNTLKPFKPGLLQAAIDARSAIIPMALRYEDAQGYFSGAAAYVGEMNLLQSIYAIISQRELQAHLTVLPPHTTEAISRSELAQNLYAGIHRSLF